MSYFFARAALFEFVLLPLGFLVWPLILGGEVMKLGCCEFLLLSGLAGTNSTFSLLYCCWSCSEDCPLELVAAYRLLWSPRGKYV